MADNRQSNNRRIKQNLVEGSRSRQNTKRKKNESSFKSFNYRGKLTYHW
ncbi:hypothetical protein VFC2021_27100 [Listeria innocua]